MERTPNGFVRIGNISYRTFTLMDCKIFPSRSKISISLLSVTIEYHFRVCVKATGNVPLGKTIFSGKAKCAELS